MMDKDSELHQITAEVYETWGGINRAFEQIISALNKLQKRRQWLTARVNLP